MKPRACPVAALLCLVAVAGTTAERRTDDPPDPYLVTSLDDPGVPGDELITLREAIDQANLAGGSVIITFDEGLAGGTIQPTSELPALSAGGITINGDIDDDGDPDIEIDGALAGDSLGLTITSSNNTLRGLAVGGFARHGIVLLGPDADSNIVVRCYVGPDLTGASANANAWDGIQIVNGADNNQIGSPSPTDRNVVSGNTLVGIYIGGWGDPCVGNVMENSYVGIAAGGASALGNGEDGIQINNAAADNTIGPDNVLSSNGWNGVRIEGAGTNGNTVSANRIGTSADGTTALGNSECGVYISNGASDCTVEDNILSANNWDGLTIESGANHVVTGNLIGTDVSGTQALPNSIGVWIRDAATNFTFGPDNVVSGNPEVGIVISNTTGITLTDNRMGTDSTGRQALPNGVGLQIKDGAYGITVGPGNVISGNDSHGVWLGFDAAACHDNTIKGNAIGTTDEGLHPLGNGEYGLLIDNAATGNVIGGPDPDDANVIAFNAGAGVYLDGPGTTGNTLIGDTIQANLGPGIHVRNDADGGTIEHCIITANEMGGVSFVDNCAATLRNCIIRKNSYDSYRGGVYCDPGHPTFIDCTISENWTGNFGGGVFLRNSDATFINCLIKDNQTGTFGGGVANYYGDPAFVNCTIVGNRCDSAGGGVYQSGGGSPTLCNCVLWDNSPYAIEVAAGFPAVTYCNVQGGWPGDGNIEEQPVFAFPDYYRLLPGPGVGEGTNTPPGGLPASDCEGVPRPSPDHGAADMSAYEYDWDNPVIGLSQDWLEVYYFSGVSDPRDTEIGIRNCGAGILSWSAQPQAAWLSVNPPTGSSAGEVNDVTLTADGLALNFGHYPGVTIFSDPAASNNPRQVMVILHVICPGDMNEDDHRNVTDFTMFAAAYPSQLGDAQYDPYADLNTDGFVNVTDFTILAAYYGTPCP